MVARHSLHLLVLAALAAGLAGCGATPATPAAGPTEVTFITATPLPPAPPTDTATPPDVAPTETATATSPGPTEAATATPAAEATAAPTQEAPTEAPSAAPASATATPPAPTAAPSATARAATATPAGPQIRSFRVSPTTTQNIGDGLDMSWEASGERAEICPISGQGPVESRCQAVALAGTTRFVTDEAAMSYVGFALRVWAGTASKLSVVNVQLQCKNLRPWFFGGPGEPAPPARCPAAPAEVSQAAGERFQHGMMVWVAEADDFYVFYEGKDTAGFQTFDWILEPQRSLRPGASPDNRTGETPPPGLFEPVSGFGMMWRGEVEGVSDDVRARLGWATEPEFAYETAHQCITPSHPHLWICFLRGPGGEILSLHPDSSAQVRFVWEEW